MQNFYKFESYSNINDNKLRKSSIIDLKHGHQIYYRKQQLPPLLSKNSDGILSNKNIFSQEIYSVYSSNPNKINMQPIYKKKDIEEIADDLYKRLLNKNKKNEKNPRSQSPKSRNENQSKKINSHRSLNESQEKNKKSSKILPPIIQIKTLKKLNYYVYPGNNGKLIEKIMSKRNERWVLSNIGLAKFCDFIWSPLSSMIDYQNTACKYQFINHFEFVNQIANKLNLYYNLLQHCEYKKLDINDYFPFTICLTLFLANYDTQISNFVELCNNLNKYTPKSHIKYIDKFNILGSKRTGETQTINIPETFNSGKNMWIIKPINLNRGRCIQVLKNTNSIISYLENIKNMKQIQTNDNNNFKCEHIIIQKYLEKPLLYQNRKFDIRIWILLIGNQENYVYIFKEGHLKATCSEFDINSDSPYIHLTNYSVQKHNEDFSKKEIGNEIPYKSFQEDLDKNNTGINFKKDIYPQIVYIIRLAIGAIKSKINYHKLEYCFEIFGCDFIIDENYKPFLLEINTNPGLEISSPLINELVPRMIDDALRLTIDEKYRPTVEKKEPESFFPVNGYNNKENLWEKFQVV